MKKRGFSLLEVLIALFIGAMIMAQLMEGMRQASMYLKRGVECSVIDRSIALLFHQLERDLTAAFIPYTYEKKKEEKKEEPGKNEPTKKNQGDKQADKKEGEFKPTYKFPFLALLNEEANLKKMSGKKRQQFSLLSFITTTPLQLFQESKPRIVRVGYQLKVVNSKNPAIPQTYTLIRKETLDCSNDRLKESDEKTKDKIKKVVNYTIAENIKSLSLQFSMQTPKPNDEKEKEAFKKRSDEEKTITSYAWGEDEKTKDKLPSLVEIYCELWDPTYTRTYTFMCSFPIFASPAEPFSLSQGQKTKLDQAQQQTPGANQPTTQQPGPALQQSQSVPPVQSSLGGGTV